MTSHQTSQQKQKWFSWPDSPGKKAAIFWLLTIVAMVFAIAGILSIKKISMLENPLPTINLMVCGLSLGTLVLTIITGRNKLFSVIFIAITGTCIITLLAGLTNPMALISGDTRALINLIAIAMSAPLFIVAAMRFCYKPGTRINSRGVGITRFIIIWLITLNTCLYMATVSEAQVTGTPSHSPSQGTYQLDASGTDASINPQVAGCWSFILFLFIVVGIILGAIWMICRATHLCGSYNGPPPSSPGTMPAVRYSNAMQLALGTSQKNVLNGSTKIGLTSSDPLLSVGVWWNTNGFRDKNLDPNYPYIYTVNYSLQATTNLGAKTGWHTVCTVVQWGTGNPTKPLICQILYTNIVTTTNSGITLTTNGYPIGTNWIQFSLDENQNVTNEVVYGGHLFMPPIDTNVPSMFFRTCYDTNHVSTIGP